MKLRREMGKVFWTLNIFSKCLDIGRRIQNYNLKVL